jgi:GTP-binding protein Era
MKTGFVAIVGFPNVGKSTLINALVGEKVAIVSPKPQTTRNKILGILTAKDYQIIFIDTPGFLKPKNILDKYMQNMSESAYGDADIIVYVIDASRGVTSSDIKFLSAVKNKAAHLIVVMNKTDIVKEEEMFSELSKLNEVPFIKEVFSISAKKDKNVKLLLNCIIKLLPESVLPENALYYPADMFTDKSLKFMASEIIREKLLWLLDHEIPHGIGVEITQFKDRDERLTDISAVIYCDKQTHKAIIIGKDGGLIKKCAENSRAEIERLLNKQVYLEVFVKVKKDWRDNRHILNELGYSE